MVENGPRIADLLADENIRDRANYAYSADLLSSSHTFPPLVWQEPNKLVVGIISGDLNYDNLPYNDDNEIYKGSVLKDEVRFVAKNEEKSALCEAIGLNPCLKEKCPLFIPKGYVDSYGFVYPQNVCREFKIVFKK